MNNKTSKVKWLSDDWMFRRNLEIKSRKLYLNRVKVSGYKTMNSPVLNITKEITESESLPSRENITFTLNDGITLLKYQAWDDTKKEIRYYMLDIPVEVLKLKTQIYMYYRK